MAIRIRPDEDGGGGNQNRPPRRDPRRGGGGGGGGIMMFLPMILGLFRKNPKMAIILLIIAGVVWYFGGCGGGGFPVMDDNPSNDGYSTGMGFDAAKYASTEIYEPLADNRKNPLPEKTSLLEYAPNRLNQGRQGSCVGWASSYAARTILHTRATGDNPNQAAFSPSYLYNQIALTGCQGAYMPDALQTLQKGGVLPFQYFDYDEGTCGRKPSSRERQAAQNFKIRGFQRLTANSGKPDMLAMKQNLAQGGPILIGMMVGGSFMRAMEGRDVWQPSRNDYQMRGFGGHAMCVIGYDDYKFGNQGGFQIMNSWGDNWGNDGVGWVSYEDFQHFTKEAYGLYPMGSSEQEANFFGIDFGVVKNKGKVNVAFKQTGKNSFRTLTPMKKNEDFKIEVTNSVECYTYVFSQETNGKIFTLFPYTAKHSPFCGIKGTRLFPKDASLYPDDEGNLDYMGVLITKEPVDYKKVEQLLNQIDGSMAERLDKVVGDQSLQNVQYEAGKTIKIRANRQGKNATFVVMEIDKD